MSDPVIDPADLAVVLSDVSSIDTDRALSVIADAQALCESVVSPLPTGAAVIVKRVAARGYVTSATARQLPAAAGGFGQPAQSGGGLGGVWLTRADKADLRRLAGGSTAFSINLLPTGYAAVVPPWDVNVVDPVIQ